MGIEKISEKLEKYVGRLEKGKTSKIKPSHVEKAIAKLQVKQRLLTEELDETTKPAKQERLKKKLSTVREQIERAEWLLGKIAA